jgi:MFS family permease
MQDFPANVQHELARYFTITMSVGIIASVVVGSLIDRIGLPFCTIVTLVFGQLQILVLCFFGKNKSVMVVGFAIYTFFRQFLFPVFIASLTGQLGFKYFGILLGIGFAISGVLQLLFATLVELVRGDCRLAEESESASCSHGWWRELHLIQFILLAILCVVPIQDHRDLVGRKRKMKELLGSPLPTPTTYGTRTGTVS